jgi:hypothetical protein
MCAKERRELSLPAAAGGLKTMGYGRMATHRPGGMLPGGHSPSIRAPKFACRKVVTARFSGVLVLQLVVLCMSSLRAANGAARLQLASPREAGVGGMVSWGYDGFVIADDNLSDDMYH